MKRHLAVIVTTAAIALTTAAAADQAVEIRMFGRYFTEPATVQLTVAIAPDRNNRVLRIEADGERMYTSSALPLVGEGEKRLHTIQFKNLAAGRYTVRAEVLSSSESVIAVAEQELVVAGR